MSGEKLNAYQIGQTFTPDDLRQLALQVADHYGVPKDLFLGLNAYESSWNPAAKNPHSSARGLGQFLDATAASYFSDPITNDENDPRLHPGKSLDATARYLVDLHKQHGSWKKAVLRYGENTQAYLDQVISHAQKEAAQYRHFEQGQFLEAAQGTDVAYGLSPEFEGPEWTQPGYMYWQLREVLGQNREPWRPSPVLQQAGQDAKEHLEQRPPLTPAEFEETLTPEERRRYRQFAVAQPLDAEELPGAFWEQEVTRRQNERELQAVLGNFIDGYALGLPSLTSRFLTGEGLPQPETPGGRFAGAGAELGGQLAGPFKWLSAFTGSWLKPTAQGLGLTSLILEGGLKGRAALLGQEMATGAINLGLLQGLSRLAPALAENQEFSDWAWDVVNHAKGGALVGMAFPLLGLLPGEGAASRVARMATGFAALDWLRAKPGEYSTVPALIKSWQTWDEESKRRFSELSYQYLLDLYFAGKTPSIKETVRAMRQEALLIHPEEALDTILKATGQRLLEEPGPGKIIPTPEVVKEINPDAEKELAVPTEGAAVPPAGATSSPVIAAPDAVKIPPRPPLEKGGERPTAETLARYPGEKLRGGSPEEAMVREAWQQTWAESGLERQEYLREVEGAGARGWPVPERVWAAEPELAQKFGVGGAEAPEVSQLEQRPDQISVKPEGKKIGGRERKRPVYDENKAEERYDRATLIKAYGKFSSRAEILKNFTQEERRQLFPFMRREAQGPDELLQELQGSPYGYMFKEFESDAALLRAIIDGKLKPRAEADLEEYYEDTIAAETGRTGATPDDLAQAEAIIEREIAAERAALQAEEEPALKLSGGQGRDSALADRLESFLREYPNVDRDKAAQVLRALPAAGNEHIALMAEDPDLFNQVARGNLSASERQQILKKLEEEQRAFTGMDPSKLFSFPGIDFDTLYADWQADKAGAKERVRALFREVKETFLPLEAGGPAGKDAGRQLIAMMGRKEEAVRKAEHLLLAFREQMKDLKPGGWVRIVSQWQRGAQTGTSLDLAYEIYHAINEDLVKQISEIRQLPYRKNYLRQAWRNAKDPDFQENINKFLAGEVFKQYLDLDAQGRPRLYKAAWDEQGRYTLTPVEGPGQRTAGETPAPPEGGKQRDRRTLTGGKGYFQPRQLDTYETGMMLGGAPRFDNLWDLMMFDISQKNQFVWGNKFLSWCYGQGLANVVQRNKMPAGWVEIQDPTQMISFTSLKEVQESMTFEEMPGDYEMTAPAKWKLGIANYVLAMPEGAARVVNNWLSEGLQAKEWYRFYRAGIDRVRRLGVSFSPFHLGFTFNSSLAQGAGQALNRALGQALSGDVEGLAQTVKEGGLNAVGQGFMRQLREGRALTEALYKGTEDPVLAGTLREYIDHGGSLPPPAALEPAGPVSLARRAAQGLWRGLIQLNPAQGGFHPFKALDESLEAGTAPIMEQAVPFAKLGGFAALRRALDDRLDAKYAKLEPGPEQAAAKGEERTQGLFDINRHLDNIYGQMNYDALLWNRTMRDLLFFVIKYPGWNIGSGRWLGAMARGAYHGLKRQELSEYERDSLQMGLGLFVNTGIYSALLYWLINGRPPEADEIGELYFKGVWTGGYTKDGNKEYISPASYWREIRAWTPLDQNFGWAPEKIPEAVKAKGADIWRIPGEVLANKEAYNNYQIADTSSLAGTVTGYGKYLGKQLIPYTVRQMYDAESGWGKYGGLVALPRTAARLTDPPARQELRRWREVHQPVLVTVQDQGKRQGKRDILELASAGQGPEFLQALRQARAEGKLTLQQYRDLKARGVEVLKDPHWGPLKNTFRRLPLEEALKVYGLADEEERAALSRQMAKKWRDARPETRRANREAFESLRQAAGQ